MPDRFKFGENWQKFIEKHFSEEQLAVAQKELLSFLLPQGIPLSLEGYDFLDIGCGSGLSSLAALKSGASRVVSFDFDSDSVSAAKHLHRYAGSPSNWTILQGDVLNRDFMESLGKFDIVYSWGVLHHTGDMWSAIENALVPVKADGLLFVALYSFTAYQNGVAFGQPSPEEWLQIKQSYLKASPAQRKLMVLRYLWRRYFKHAQGNPAKLVQGARELYDRWKNYGANSRGMNFFTDIHDWLGGWPMQFVHEAEMIDRLNQWGMDLLRMKTGRGNTEFLFRPKQVSNLWDKALLAREFFPLSGPFKHYDASVWRAELPASMEKHGNEGDLNLLEDGVLLPFGHCPLRSLVRFGSGRYLQQGRELLFSTGDNSDPNTNQKKYTYFLDKY